MSTFTPGPWIVEDPMGPDRYSIVQDGLEPHEWQFIAHVDVGIPAEAMMPRQEARANARLIAAAPDLLAALKLVWDTSCTNATSTPSRAAFFAMKSAIAKAEPAQ